LARIWSILRCDFQFQFNTINFRQNKCSSVSLPTSYENPKDRDQNYDDFYKMVENRQFPIFLTRAWHDLGGFFSEPDYYKSIDRIKKLPDAKNQRRNPYCSCKRGLPNIKNWPKLLLCMEKWKILEPTRQILTIQIL
jgi:hypothetical protein